MRLSCTVATVGAGSSLHRMGVLSAGHGAVLVGAGFPHRIRSAGPNHLIAAERPARWAAWVS